MIIVNEEQKKELGLDNAMNEKEFILSVFEAIWPDVLLQEPSLLHSQLDNFLEYHHEYYYQIKFVKKPAVDNDPRWEDIKHLGKENK